MVAPVNDHWDGALEVTLDGSGEYVSSAIDSTDADADTGSTYTSTRKCWWKFTPTADDTISVDTYLSTASGGTFWDTSLEVWTGPDKASFVLVTKNDDGADAPAGTGAGLSKVPALAVTAGTTYYFEVGSWAAYPLQYVLRVTGTPTGAVTPSGLGLVLDSMTVSDVVPPLSGASALPLHIVAPTVPIPTLVNGRPS